MSNETWQEIQLGQFVSLQRGHDLTEAERQPGPIPVMGSAGQNGYHSVAKARGPGVTIGRSGASFGVVNYSACDYWPHNTVLYVTDFHGNDERFAYYLLKNLDFSGFNSGSAQPSLNRNYIYSIPVRVPPLRLQRSIASLLGALDNKIDLNRCMNETLEAMARTIFQSWFVDFDPVRAKAEGQQPWGMDAETAAMFPAGFNDADVGDAPRGWTVGALHDVCDFNPPRRLSKNASAPYLDMANMPTNGVRALGWYNRPAGSGARFTNGDVLLARITPCLENGKTAFVDFLSEGEIGWGSTEFIVMRSKPRLPEEFVYFIARHDAFRTHAIQSMTGTSGRQRVPVDALFDYPVVIPPPNIAKQFGEIVRPLFAEIKANDSQSETLAALRDTLLPKLMSGEVSMKEAEQKIEEEIA